MAKANKSNAIFGIKNTFLEVRESAIEGNTDDDVLQMNPIRQYTDPCPASRSYSLSSDDYIGNTRQISASQASTDEPHAPMQMMGRSYSIAEESMNGEPYERQVTEPYWPAWSESMPAISNQQMFSQDSWCLPVPVMMQAPVAPDDWGGYTTVMMRNLPNKYTQHMLLEKLHELGFAGTFDFLYLPIDRETNANKGYCFINFAEPYYAWMLKTSCEGQKMGRFNSSKEVSVVPASLQGFEANYAHYSNTNVNRGDPTARPLFLREPDSSQLRKARHGGGSRKSQTNTTKQHQMNPDSQISGLAAPQSAGQADAKNTYIEKGSGPNSGQGKGKGSSAEHIQASQASHQKGQSSKDASRKPRFCPFCGTKREDNFNFCSSCGQAFAQS